MTKHFPAFRLTKYLPYEIVCFVLVIVAVYFGTLDHPFHFDDRENISNKSFIQISSLSLDELKKAGFESTNRHRPVANISFALNYYFHGLDVTGYHVVNIIIHLFAGIMLYYFIRETLGIPTIKDKFGEPGYIAFFTALIWMVHPLHTQSITYIVQRMNSMAAMFYILALLFYVKARLTPAKVRMFMFFIVSFIAGLLAFGSKQNTATLPVFIFLYEGYFFQDLRFKISKKQIFWIITIGLIVIFVIYPSHILINRLKGKRNWCQLIPLCEGRRHPLYEQVLVIAF